MGCSPLLALAFALAATPPLPATSTARGGRVVQQGPTFSVGHPPPAAQSLADIDVLPDGRGLPPGRGTAAEGKTVYASRCASCHGATGREGPNDVLAGGQGTLASARPVRTVGSYWPYATSLWDYINRAMPFAQPRSLTADQVYAVTAYILHLNGIIGEADVLSAETLPRVRMPNRDGFIPDGRPHENLPRR
jgi:S-disulfanyl-L-cysteine oxidoreductase SoxD